MPLPAARLPDALQANIAYPTEGRLCTAHGIQQARQSCNQGSGGGSSFRRGGGRGGGVKPGFGGSGFGGATGGRGFGRWQDPHTEHTWEALLVLASVADAFDDTGPAKAWEVLQAAEKGSGVALLRQDKAQAYLQLREQLQVGSGGLQCNNLPGCRARVCAPSCRS